MDSANEYLEHGINDQCLSDLSQSLRNLQSRIIGAFLVNHNQSHMIMVIEKSKHHVRCITIGTLFGYADSMYDISAGRFVALPNGYDNLAQLLCKPFEFNDWLTNVVQFRARV